MAPPTGLQGSEQALLAALSGTLGQNAQGSNAALQLLQGGGASALNRLDTTSNSAAAPLNPFATAGLNANNLQANFSGANGNAAQSQAFTNFQNSPGQAFIRDQGEQSILRNASALGGLGGGGVQKDLMGFGQGLASTEFDKMFQRLNPLAERGFAGAQGQSALINSGGQAGANLIGDFAQAGSNIRQRQGEFGGNATLQTGFNQAGGRTRAGEQIAGAIGNTTSALTDLRNQQGLGVQNILANETGNIANLLAGLGQGEQASQQALATLLANLASNQGSQVGGLPSIPGVQQTQGALGGVGQLAGGIGGLFTGLNT